MDAGSGGFTATGGLKISGSSTFNGNASFSNPVTFTGTISASGPSSVFANLTAAGTSRAIVSLAPTDPTGQTVGSLVVDNTATIGFSTTSYMQYAVLDKANGKFSATGGVGFSNVGSTANAIANAVPGCTYSVPDGNQAVDIATVLLYIINKLPK